MSSYAYNEEITSYYIEKSARTKAASMPGSHYHNHYEIYYLTKGKARYFIDNTTYDIEAGDMILISPYIIHKTTYVEDGELERVLITFTLDFMEKSEDDDTLRCFEKCCIKNADLYEGLINSIVAEKECPDDFSDRLIKSYINTLLIKLSRITEKNYPEGGAPTLMQQVTEYINENYSADIGLYSLSKTFSVSKSHLSRQFKATTGLGITEYITTVRIRNAERLLLATDLSVTKIATKCGFNDSNYFSSVFKKMKGISPLKFKNNQ